MFEHSTTRRRRNALADIFNGISPEKVEQLQSSANDYSESETDSSVDVVRTTTAATHSVSAPLNQNIVYSSSIDPSRRACFNGIFCDQITTDYLELADSENSEDTVSDDEEDERYVTFINSPQYRQRRFGIVEHNFSKNFNMLNTIASH